MRIIYNTEHLNLIYNVEGIGYTIGSPAKFFTYVTKFDIIIEQWKCIIL